MLETEISIRTTDMKPPMEFSIELPSCFISMPFIIYGHIHHYTECKTNSVEFEEKVDTKGGTTVE